ncbi:MAG: hypothetical protein LBW85_05155 [Deltaproteobacteria bacterium]|jgi:hypothetical protein|nr:hypothetical protein [Deltaproteobacteria bacterium]
MRTEAGLTLAPPLGLLARAGGLLGVFLDFLTGGSVKVAVNRLVRAHLFYRGNYGYVFTNRVLSLTKKTNTKHKNKLNLLLELIYNNKILNYTDLCILDLYISISFNNITYDDIYYFYRKDIWIYLIKKNLPLDFILNDNTKISGKIIQLFLDNLKLFNKNYISI